MRIREHGSAHEDWRASRCPRGSESMASAGRDTRTGRASVRLGRAACRHSVWPAQHQHRARWHQGTQRSRRLRCQANTSGPANGLPFGVAYCTSRSTEEVQRLFCSALTAWGSSQDTTLHLPAHSLPLPGSQTDTQTLLSAATPTCPALLEPGHGLTPSNVIL